ncbi:MAG: zinc ribbon domain-containing protein [Saccharofermentans sp.]|nr:zinc ribbon domain-containing protein [Saccharofermentans sp.]
MLFCRKCGGPMEDGDHVCLKCGTVVGQENEAEKEKELIRQLSEYQTLLSECEELETMIKPQSNFPSAQPRPAGKKSFIRYFWPFIIGAAGGYIVVYVLATMISMYSNISSYNPYKPGAASKGELEMAMFGDIMLGYVVAIIVAVAIIIIGIKIARSKQKTYNSGIDRMNDELSERYRKGLLNEKMIALHTENVHKMALYEDLVPEEYRTARQVASLIGILKEDKAQTVEEAIRLI